MFAGKTGVEALQHSHDVLALAYRPDGKQLASATLNGDITFWDPIDGVFQVRLYTRTHTHTHTHHCCTFCEPVDGVFQARTHTHTHTHTHVKTRRPCRPFSAALA